MCSDFAGVYALVVGHYVGQLEVSPRRASVYHVDLPLIRERNMVLQAARFHKQDVLRMTEPPYQLKVA